MYGRLNKPLPTPHLKMETHNLKVWPDHFRYLLDGTKTAEVRKKERNYKVGDLLILNEWDRETKCYTGRKVEKTITHILKDFYGLADGYVLLSLKSKHKRQAEWRMPSHAVQQVLRELEEGK